MHDGLKKTMVALAIVAMGAVAVTLDAQQGQGRGGSRGGRPGSAVAEMFAPSA